jgi:DNA-binding MarR family transcriptional regulator
MTNAAAPSGTSEITRAGVPTGAGPAAGVPEPLPEIERAFSGIVRWGNLPRVRERFLSAAGMDLDRASYGVLIRLDEGGPIRLSDLAQRIGLDLSTASRQVHHLQIAGLVERVTVEEDRRAALLSTTAAGREMVERLRSAKRGVITEILAGWSPAERCELARVLARLADDIVAFGCQER